MRFDGLRAYLYGLTGLVNVVLLRFKDAERCINRGIELSPGMAYNYGLRAYTRLCLDDLDGAIEDCTVKLELSPRDAGTFALRAWAFYLMNNYEQATADLEKSIAIEPARRWYHFDCLRLVDSYRELNEQQKIISFVTATIKPGLERTLMVELLSRRARANHLIGHDDKAILDYNNAIGLASHEEMIELYSERSKVYEKLRLEDLAEKDKMTSAQLQSHKAQMTEWLPANPQQRLIAQMIDASVVGCISAFFVFVVANGVDIACGGSPTHFVFEMSQWQPLIIITFAIGVADALFVCLGPVLITACLSMLVISGQEIDLLALASPLSHPEIGISVAVSVVVIVNCLYHSLMESSPQESTLGKSVFRLRVTDFEGGRLTWHRAIVRHLLKIIPSAIVVAACVLLSSAVLDASGAIVIRAIVALLSIFLFALGIMSIISPGVHNCFAGCLVTDNHLYTPSFKNILSGPMDRDGN